MKSWVKLLPFFIVAWLARKYCMRWQDGTIVYATAFHGVGEVTMIEVERIEE